MVTGMIAFLTVFVVGGVMLARHYSQQPSNPRASSSAVDILQQRFARGEISDEEYSRSMGLLKGES